MWEILVFCFNMNKSAATVHLMVPYTYAECKVSENLVMCDFSALSTVILLSKTLNLL